MLYFLLAPIIATAIVLWRAILMGYAAITLGLEKLELFVEGGWPGPPPTLL